MVVAFVGFVGGWTHAVLGSDSLFLSGAVAAVVVTYFTFLPSFCFVLLGGPLIESTHGDLRFTAPLTGITAAVVGVIVNLALFFAWHVLWPAGSGGRFDAVAAAIGVAGGSAAVPLQGRRDAGARPLRRARPRGAAARLTGRQALAAGARFAAARRRRATRPSRPSAVNANTEGSGTAVTSKGSAYRKSSMTTMSSI